MNGMEHTGHIISWHSLIVWIIVGIISGSFAGMLVKRKRQGFGILVNLGIGMGGALIGGILFNVLHILEPLAKVKIDAQQLAGGVTGSLLLLLGIWLYRKHRSKLADRKARMVPGVEG